VPVAFFVFRKGEGMKVIKELTGIDFLEETA
jgi:hypothetical protein